MAVKTVQFTINNQTYDLNYDSGSGTYKATVTAPTTRSTPQKNRSLSWGN